jgi:hypothetical protein
MASENAERSGTLSSIENPSIGQVHHGTVLASSE